MELHCPSQSETLLWSSLLVSVFTCAPGEVLPVRWDPECRVLRPLSTTLEPSRTSSFHLLNKPLPSLLGRTGIDKTQSGNSDAIRGSRPQTQRALEEAGACTLACVAHMFPDIRQVLGCCDHSFLLPRVSQQKWPVTQLSHCHPLVHS